MLIHTPVNEKRRPPARNRRKKKTNRDESILVDRYGRGPGLVFSPSPTGHHETVAYAKKKSERNIKWPKVRPWKIIVGTIIAGLAGLFYLNHVFKTQQLFSDVNHLQREYNKAAREYADRRYVYNQMIGPAEIYDKAHKLGLINSGTSDKIVIVPKP